MKNKNNLILIAIIGLGIIIRIFFWFKINNNFYNWDESYHGLSGLIIYKFILSGFNLNYLQEIIEHYWSAIYSLFFYPYGYSIFTSLSLLLIGSHLLALRLPAMIFSILLIIITYLTGRELFNKKIGLLAAFFTALNPYLILFGGLALVDIPMTFFMVGAVYFLLKILKTNHTKYYILTGLFIGLAGFMKPPGFIILIPILALIISYKKINIQQLKRIAILIFFTLIFFMIYFGSGLLIYFLYNNIPLRDTITYYIFHWFLGSKTIPASSNISWLTLPGWLFYIKTIPNQVGGYLITFLVASGFIVLINNHNKKEKTILLSLILFIYLIFVLITKKDQRFIIPYLPLLSIVAALAIDQLYKVFKNIFLANSYVIFIGFIITLESIIIGNNNLNLLIKTNNYYNLIPATKFITDNTNNQSTIIATDRDDKFYGNTIPDISLLVLLNDPNLIYSVYYKNQATDIDYFITANKIIDPNWVLINQINNHNNSIYTYKFK